MKNAWNLVRRSNMSGQAKNSVFILLTVLKSFLAGALIWVLAGRFFLPDYIWLVCFACYPAILIGLFGGILYLYKHEFSEL